MVEIVEQDAVWHPIPCDPITESAAAAPWAELTVQLGEQYDRVQLGDLRCQVMMHGVPVNILASSYPAGSTANVTTYVVRHACLTDMPPNASVEAARAPSKPRAHLLNIGSACCCQMNTFKFRTCCDRVADRAA